MKHHRHTDLSPNALDDRIHLLEEHASTMARWKATVEENTEATLQSMEFQKDMLNVLRGLGWIGKVIKWLAIVATGAAGLIAAIRGVWPHA